MNDGSPFAGSPAGVSMSTDSVGGEPAGLDQAGGERQEREAPQRQERAPANRQASPPQRARAGDFTPHQQRSNEAAQVIEGLLGSDDGDIETGASRTAGAELARREQSEVAEMSKRDEARQRGRKPVIDVEYEEPEASPIDASVIDWDAEEFKAHPHYAQFAEMRDSAAKLEGDQLHADLHARFVPVELDVEAGGQLHKRQYMLTVSDLARGFMRQSDYTRKLDTLYAYEDALNQRERGLAALEGNLRSGDPEQFMRMIRYMGALEGFQRSAYMWGAQIAAEEAMTPEQRKVLAYNRHLQDQLYRAQLEAQNAHRALHQQRSTQQQAPSVDEQYLVNQLQQLLPRAKELMAKRGRPYVESDKANDLLLSSWNTFLRTRDPSSEFTTEGIANVLEGVMEQIEQLMSAGYIQAPPPRATQMLPPVSRQAPAPAGARTAQQAGAPNYGGNGRQPPRARISDLGSINRQGR